MAGHHRPLAALLVMLVVAALIGVAVYVAVRLASRRPGAVATPGAPTDAALELARMRYARGELTRDDYTRVVSDLGGQPPSP